MRCLAHSCDRSPGKTLLLYQVLLVAFKLDAEARMISSQKTPCCTAHMKKEKDSSSDGASKGLQPDRQGQT